MSHSASAIQLPLLLDEPAIAGGAIPRVFGYWAAAERLVTLGAQTQPAKIWFHFARDGAALLSIRCWNQRRSTSAAGLWRIDDTTLTAKFGRRTIAAPYTVDRDLLCWAGETLVRHPENLPFDDPRRAPLHLEPQRPLHRDMLDLFRKAEC